MFEAIGIRGGYIEFREYVAVSPDLPKSLFSTPHTELYDTFQGAKRLYEAGSYVKVLEWATRELGWAPEAGHSDDGRNDTVHDLLAYLAEEMTSMHTEQAEINRVWRDWVEAVVPKAAKLTKTFRETEWAEIGCEQGWHGVLAVFQKRKAVPDAKTLSDLKRETEKALGEICPLRERIQATDDLIDQIVYRLYGLTGDEIAAVEASIK